MRGRLLLGLVLGLLLRGWVATLRLQIVGGEPALHAELSGKVFAFFHGQQFGLLTMARRSPLGTLVSWSRDGWLQTGIMRGLGLAVFRGSSGRGGAGGFRGLLRWLGADPARSAAFAVDGSHGPFGSIKPGAARLAAELEQVQLAQFQAPVALLVPVASAARWRIVFAQAWDRFELPLPFSRVAVALGPALSAKLASEQPELVAQGIDTAHQRARAAVSAPGHLVGSRVARYKP